MERFPLEKFKKWKIGALISVLGILILTTILSNLWLLLSLYKGDHRGCTGYAIIIFVLYLIRHAVITINIREQGMLAKLRILFNRTMDAMEFSFILSASIIILRQETLEQFFGWLIIVLLTAFVTLFIIKFIMRKKSQPLKAGLKNQKRNELLWLEAGSSTNFDKSIKPRHFGNTTKYHT